MGATLFLFVRPFCNLIIESLELTATITYDELVEKCKQGDRLGYSQLYNKYAKAMYNTSLRIVNNTADAEDVLQDAFTDAFKHLNEFRYNSTFGAWLKRIVINKSISLLRKRKMQLVDIDSNPVADNSAETDGIDETAFAFKVDAVKQAIALLPDGYRTVVNLYLVEAIPQEEIGTLLGISHNTVRTQYHRAKQKLLTILKEGGVE
ncbi:MAG: RNA polymerase sigma factor [Sphingobacteriales bacterium]|jgi:RNA polymerase sigma factor (sigma-70 family)|nr:MAG: RNA polymerase sigma factor [Sphingobacteriales bacterium]